MRTSSARLVCAVLGLASALAQARPAAASTPALKPAIGVGAGKLIPVRAAQTIAIRETGAAAEIGFENIGVSGAETGADNLEMTLRFDGPLDAAAAESLAAKLPKWIAYATPGYDSLLIRTRKKAAFSVARTETGFTLRIAWAADPQAAGRENLQRLRYLTMTGETVRARAMLNELRKLPPEGDQLDRAEAELLVSENKRREGLRLYERLSSASPADIGLRRSVTALRRDLSDYAEAEIAFQSVEDADDQSRLKLRGRIAAGPSSVVMAELTAVQMDAPSVQRTDGAITPFDGSNMKLRASYDVESGGGIVWSAIVYAGAAGVGAGGEVRLRRGRFEGAIEAAYNESSLDLVESIVNDGARHSIEARAIYRGGRNWSVGGAVGYRQYDLDNVSAAAVSATVDAFARYEVEAADDVTVVFGYALDAEYVGDVAVKLNGLGAAFTPLPLADREVHSLGIGVVAEWNDRFGLDAMAGYAYDRYAEGGAFARASLTYDVTDHWRAFANAAYTQVNARGTGGGAVTAGALGLTYLFGGPGQVLKSASQGYGP